MNVKLTGSGPNVDGHVASRDAGSLLEQMIWEETRYYRIHEEDPQNVLKIPEKSFRFLYNLQKILKNPAKFYKILKIS